MENIQKEIISKFIDFFGEEFVDAQEDIDKINVIIYFPKLTVTNEYNNSIDIKDTFVKFYLYKDGSINSSLFIKRTYFTYRQYLCRYIHSHCPRFAAASRWESFCLGTGPIKNTIRKIADNAALENIDLDLYSLFAAELKLILQVESLNGGPYTTLNSVNNYQNTEYEITPIYGIKVRNPLLDDFIKYLCKEQSLEFTFNGCYYDFAYNDNDLMIILANKFIRYYSALRNKPYTTAALYTTMGILSTCTKRDGCLFLIADTVEISSDENRNTHLTFKGKEVPLIIEQPDHDDTTYITILSIPSYSYVKTTILEKLNYETAIRNYERAPMLTILNN
nr:MAG TPA: hypothetical protein [Crassvirales sp.]